MKYERLTERRGRGVCVKETSTNDNRSIWNAIDRLAELEDKIENGTLIEMPRMLTYVDYCYGLEKYVVEWIDNGRVKSRTYWNQGKAEKKLKELHND